MFSAESSHISFSVALMTRKDWRIGCHAPLKKNQNLKGCKIFMAVLNQLLILLLTHAPCVLKFRKNQYK